MLCAIAAQPSAAPQRRSIADRATAIYGVKRPLGQGPGRSVGYTLILPVARPSPTSIMGYELFALRRANPTRTALPLGLS